MRKLWTDVVEVFKGTDRFRPNGRARPELIYPVDLAFTLADEARYYAPLDSSGIPVKVYSSIGPRYNPTRIAAYALAHFNRYALEGDDRARSTFLQTAEWFMHATDARWNYDFDWGELRAPWISCMAQGEGISVLVRAHALTGQERFVEQARLAAQPFTGSIAEGGVRSLINGTHPFLEEYPTSSPAHTLNGFLYALIGIDELRSVEPGIGSEVRFDDLVDTLATQWLRWDIGFWSTYDLSHEQIGIPNPATVAYQQLHITQVLHLAGVLSQPELAVCAERWKHQATRLPNRLAAFASKVRFRLRKPAQR